MINGLDHANYNQLTGLYDLRATSIATDDISYDEISTLNNIKTNQTIQTQIDNLQNTLGGISLTISGNTLSGVVLLPYLTEYYDDKTEVTEKVGNAYNTIMDTLTNYYTKSSINSITSTISGQIVTISDLIYNTISSNINNNSLSITSVSSYINNTISSNIYNNSLSITSVSSYINNTISSNIYIIIHYLSQVLVVILIIQ